MSVLPAAAEYSVKPSSVRCERYERIIPSLGNNPNSGYVAGDTIVFYLPGGLPDQVMDGRSTYLKFQVVMTITAGADIADDALDISMDNTGASPIRRLDLYGSGGSLVESIDHYNVLSSMLNDVSYSYFDLIGKSSLDGSGQGESGYETAAQRQEIYAVSLRKGYRFTNHTGITNGNVHVIKKTFCIPILSSMFHFAEKYFPIWAINDDLRIEITLDSLIYAFGQSSALVSAPLTSVYIANPEIHVDYLKIDSAAMGQIKSMTAGSPITIHSTSWHNYQTSIAAGTSTGFNTILPSKVKSAKHALFSFRNLSVTGATQLGYATSVRCNPLQTAGNTFNLNIGGNRVPQRPLTTAFSFANTNLLDTGDVSEYAAELQRAFHSIGDTRFNGCLPYDCFIGLAAPLNTTYPGESGFMIGLNLDSLRGQSDAMMSGTDLSGVTTYIEGNFSTLATLLTLDTFVYHDCLLVIDPSGTLVSRF